MENYTIREANETYEKIVGRATLKGFGANEMAQMFDEFVEQLEFNIKGLEAELKDLDFDWANAPSGKYYEFILNELSGDICMDYTIKADTQEIIDFDKALIASVNHKGDSDSTGAVTGNILGAKLGLAGIPEKYTGNLELKDVILRVADDLWRG